MRQIPFEKDFFFFLSLYCENCQHFDVIQVKGRGKRIRSFLTVTGQKKGSDRMRTSHHRRIVVVIHIHYTIQAITEQQLVLSCSSHVCRDCVVCSVGVCIRMDQIFGNRCLTWRVLRMC